MLGKALLPEPLRGASISSRQRRKPKAPLGLLALCLVSLICTFYWHGHSNNVWSTSQRIPLDAQQVLMRCAALRSTPGPPSNFLERSASDRFEEGTPATIIRNAAIWTGEENGTEVIYGDLLLDKGIVKAIGQVPRTPVRDARTIDAKGAWVTPGLIDLHSHVGLYSLPTLKGTFNLDSNKGPILPWLRTIDAFDTHDDSIQLVMAGGVTSVQVLPGSLNAIAGQAFMMKLRKTAERSPTSMIIEPPRDVNGSYLDSSDPPRWRYLKQSVGENVGRFGNRMDIMWAYRQAYQRASQIKAAQDAYCARAEAGLWNSIVDDFPEGFQYEALVDVLRGRVKVSQDVYETVDIDAIVRLSNEFHFHVDSIHHAAEAWLVPNVLNQMWGGPPAVALFSDYYRNKRESYRGSVHAPRILADHNFSVILQTDHPVLNGRYLLYEAQEAYHYGLPLQLALASVTTAPAAAAGLSHRLGSLRPGMDADVVLWDSHPLRLGATPVTVWVDGIMQPLGTEIGVLVGKGKEAPEWREPPNVPNWKQERQEALKWDGLPPLEVDRVSEVVVFANVSAVLIRGAEGIEPMFHSSAAHPGGVVIIDNGKIICAGVSTACNHLVSNRARLVDLEGGVLAPAFISFGSNLGLQEIAYERSTGDGLPFDPFSEDVPGILRDPGGIVQAADALEFQTRNALLAYRAGVTAATSPPYTFFFEPTFTGLSATFRTGAPHALTKGAVIQRVSALHCAIRRPNALVQQKGHVQTPSVSTRIAVLRRLLLADVDERTGETAKWFTRAADGALPLIIDVGSADVMAALLELKEEVEQKRGTRMRVVFSGAAEAHLLAKEIGRARVGVILTPSRPIPETWDDKRILPGPPVSNDTALVTLLENNVLVGIGTADAALAAQTRFDLAWATAESNGRVSPERAIGLGTVNLERLLGIDQAFHDGDMIAWARGGPLDMQSSVAGVVSSAQGWVDLL